MSLRPTCPIQQALGQLRLHNEPCQKGKRKQKRATCPNIIPQFPCCCWAGWGSPAVPSALGWVLLVVFSLAWRCCGWRLSLSHFDSDGLEKQRVLRLPLHTQLTVGEQWFKPVWLSSLLPSGGDVRPILYPFLTCEVPFFFCSAFFMRTQQIRDGSAIGPVFSERTMG